MNLRHDFELDMATAHTRLSKKWKNRRWKWSDVLQRCSDTKRTGETVKEYMRMTREEQSDVKDVGGFVGGYLRDGTRKTPNVAWRSMATLDVDFGTANVWDDFTMAFNFAAMLYSTHKHTAEKPRYRLVIPFSRSVTPAEYEPICRKIAADIGIDLFDITTYQLPRLFYWPSTSKDGEYVFEYQDGPACDVDAILATYANYKDVSTWPISSREGDVVAHEIRKAGDPLEKPGLIGAFCRAYTIEEVIENFLPDAYEKTATEGRYTYKKGSVAGGLVCYEGKFAFSHHETDPASMQLCNAFDLCRVHLFGEHDEGTRQTDITKRPSYEKMQEFASKDKTVRIMINKERSAEAASDFSDIEEAEEVDTDWLGDLDMDKRGNVKSTATNIIRILENDPGLKGRLWHDLFSGMYVVKNGLPWDKTATQWRTSDDANLRIYLEERYNVTGKDKIKDAREAVFTRRRVHPVRDYLNGLTWDGTPRLERLIIDYIGAEDSLLNRTMTRMQFTAAVKRVMQPGCKHDYCLVLTGAEGIGKSTLFAIMGGKWFNDSLTTTEGKNGMEQLRRSWIIELAELSSIKRSDVEQVKNYISRPDDIYREPYKEFVESHPRQCVFFGTTNEDTFLKGDKGNRRFWIIKVEAEFRKHPDFVEALRRDRDQLWAEAVQLYKEGGNLYLPPELEAEARQRQAEYNDDKDDPMLDMLLMFLDMRLPVDWASWDLKRRRAYISNPDPLDEEGTVMRDRFCIPEFMCERLGFDLSSKDYKYTARKVARLMGGLEDWEKASTSRHAEKLYGTQRLYRRVVNQKESGEDDDI